jgi:hypothetical protein
LSFAVKAPDRPDAGNAGQPPAQRIAAMPGHQFGIRPLQRLLERRELPAEQRQQPEGQRRQLSLGE